MTPASRDGVGRPIGPATTNRRCSMTVRKSGGSDTSKPGGSTDIGKLASPAVTLTPEALQAVINQAVAEAIEAQKRKIDATVAKSNGQSSQSNANAMAAIKAFKKAGFGLVKPHEDVKTFNKWAELGLRPKEGSKAVRVKNLRLFHKSQCRPITSAEKAELVKQKKAAIARHSAENVTPLHQ
jgi:hypothetical protein